MDLLKYRFITESRFTPSIAYHAFKLRCIPMNTDFQHVQDNSISVSPECNLLEAFDGFGNRICYGSVSADHDFLRIVSEGVVQCKAYAIRDLSPDDIYLFATPLTHCNAEMLRMADNMKKTANPLEEILHAVHATIAYERFVTDNATTAEWAFVNRRGVCQDFAHVMIALCRAAGYHARYAAGLVTGEGETHAWVEVNVGGVWRGYDPTYDKIISEGYIKLAHGRDASDCPINRGRFYQWTSEILSVTATVISTSHNHLLKFPTH